MSQTNASFCSFWSKILQNSRCKWPFLKNILKISRIIIDNMFLCNIDLLGKLNSAVEWFKLKRSWVRFLPTLFENLFFCACELRKITEPKVLIAILGTNSLKWSKHGIKNLLCLPFSWTNCFLISTLGSLSFVDLAF